jgi:AraC family transcriptional regulator
MMKMTTEQDYRRRIARVIAAILADPAAPHTVESLAEVAHLSAFHFHRIYRGMAGETVADTVKRLRLAQAAGHLLEGRATVTAVALDAGYESPQAFARAFRGFAGLSPSAYQQRQKELAMAGDGPFSAASPGPSGETAGLPVMVREFEPLDAVCLLHDGPLATIRQTFRDLFRRLAKAGIGSADLRRIGIGFGDPAEKEGFRYLAGVVAEPDWPLPVGVSRHPVPGGTYGVYRLVGPYDLIAPTFQALFGGWLPRSGFLPDDRPAVEIYVEGPPSVSPDRFVTDLLIPIREGGVLFSPILERKS